MGELTPERWRELSPHLDLALEMSGDQRAAYLADLRLRDAALAGELEILLEEGRGASRDAFLEAALPLPPPDASLAGQTFGAYTLDALIGQGGMGNVWLAHRSDGRFEGKAAVKLLNASLLGRAGEGRFRREGQVLARLADPHIARLIDAGVSASGQPYLVIEYVEGEPLDRFCDEHGLTVEERLRLFLDVLEAVAHAHSNLIVHRDIKPSNVLVDRSGRAKLLDFGIAKLLESEGEAAAMTALTREGGRALTPEFAAPEQVTDGVVTTATDVYALGILLYLLLTGRHPAGETGRSPAELVRWIVEKEPDRASDAVGERRSPDAEARQRTAGDRSTTPDALGKILRGDLDTVVAKCLKKNPSERYVSVTALADDLRRFLRHEPVSARPDSLRYRSAKFLRRHRVAVAAAATVLAAAVAGTAMIVARGRDAQRQRDAARQQLARATAANEFLGFLLSVAAPAGRKISVSDLLAQGEGLADKQFADNPAMHSEMLATIGERYMNAENWEKALTTLERAAAMARDPGQQARALCPLALAKLANGDRKTATAMITAAIAQLPDEPQYALQRAACLCRFAEFGYYTDEAEPMIRHAREAIAVLGSASVPSKPERTDAEASLAYGYYLARDNARADQAFAKVMAALESTGRDRTIAAADTLNNWGLVHFDGDIVRAEPLLRRSVELHRQVEGEVGPTPTTLLNYAAALFQLARYDEAESLYAETIRTSRARAEHRIEIDAMVELADLYLERGELDHAAAQLSEVDRSFRVSPLFVPLRQAQYAYARGLLALKRGEWARARELFADSLRQLDKSEAKFNVNVFALIGLARAEKALGHPEDAERAARRALELAQSFVPKGTPSYMIGHAQAALAEILLWRGDRASAQATIAAATDQLTRSLGGTHPAIERARLIAQAAAGDAPPP
ncbi:MAG: protein kinase domain-containing protein [Syntrophomonadaceae bacterium]